MVGKLIELVFDTLPYPMWIKTKDGVFLSINKKFKEMYIDEKLSKEDVIGKTNKDVFAIGVYEKYDRNYNKVVTSKKAMVFEDKINDQITKVYITPILDEEGNIIAVSGIIKDITDTRKYEENIIKQNTLLETIINTIPDMIFYKDINSKYIGGNKAFFEGFFGKEKSEVIGKTDIEIHKSKEVAKSFIKSDKEIIKNKETQYTKVELLNKENKLIYAEGIKTPLINERGEVWGIVGISRDMTERKELEKKLTVMSYTDKLTGVYNRAYFEEQIKKLDDKKHYPLSLIMGDVNGLKLVNDTLGHLEGDKLITQITQILRYSCRKEDLIFRWGGDEFIILLPNTDYKSAERICEKIVNKCKQSKNQSLPLSISLGVSTKIDDKKGIDEILKEAEDMLYRDKLLTSNSIRSSVLASLQKTLEEKNIETKEHIERMLNYAVKIGNKLNLSNAQLNELKLLAWLHDIGKIGVSENILMKKEKLTKDEVNIIESHSEKGFRIAQSLPDLAHIAYGILTHHERYDGKGYPLQLKGEEIPILSRIIAVIDSFDAMTNDRIHAKAMSKEAAIKELKNCSGTQFDPKIIDIFINEIIKI